MGNLEQALDLGQGVYTQAEIDAIPSSLSKVASNVLLSGNLALASSAVTKSNANITYTGNGSTQSITTGIASVDFTQPYNGSGGTGKISVDTQAYSSSTSVIRVGSSANASQYTIGEKVEIKRNTDGYRFIATITNIVGNLLDTDAAFERLAVQYTVTEVYAGYYHDRAAGDCIIKNDAGTVIESGSAVVNVSKVHIKGRSFASNNRTYDGLRGILKGISSNNTATEATFTDADSFNAFTATGFTLGADAVGTEINRASETFIAHQTLYTHIKWGLTNQGKRYLTAYNPVTREVMTMYQGSGVAGHQIPNALGIKLDYLDVKNLTTTRLWNSQAGSRIRLSLSENTANNGNFFHTFAEDYTSLVDGLNIWNSSTDTYISYGFANSETKIIKQYQGTGVAGNFIETKDVNGVAKKPRRVIIKRTDGAASWAVLDSKRGGEQCTFLNLSASEYTSAATSLSFDYNGFTNLDNYEANNASGSQYIAIVEFDTTNSTDDTYFDLPTDDTNLNVTAGKLPYTDGRDTTNGAYNVFTQSYTGSVDFSTCPDGIHYVGLDSNNAPKFYEEPKVGIDAFNVWFDKDSGKWYEPYNLVTNGDFDTDTSGWASDNGATLSVVLNKLRVDDNGSDGQATQNITTVNGVTYIVSADVKTDGTAFARIKFGSLYHTETSSTDIVRQSLTFTATSTITTLKLDKSSLAGQYALFDNISVTPVEYDTSILTELSNPISFIDDKPYQVASGTPMDRLVDYPSIPKNVMESSYVDGDLEISGDIVTDGEFVGKNACTAWVNFDGTTTPPTIRDSYNVKDVVRVSTGTYDIYFENEMDNTNYCVSGIGRDDTNDFPGVGTFRRSESPQTTNYFRLETYYGATANNVLQLDAQIFGGK